MRFWFGRKSAPDARPFVPAWLNTEQQPGFGRSYDAQFEEVYRRNPVGQRAVRLVAGMLGALPVYAVDAGRAHGRAWAAAGCASEVASAGRPLRAGMWPPSPIELAGQFLSDGSLSLSWKRRSRLGWLWRAGAEPPLGESAERYKVVLQGSAGSLNFQPTTPDLVVAADALAGMTGTLTVEVVQVGDYASSRPATLAIDI